MKRSLTVLLLIPAFLACMAFGQKPMAFDPNGGEFQISGQNPAGFSSFQRMYLETRNANGKRVRPNGSIDFGQIEYEMRNIVFDGRRWSFDTVLVNGVSFSFAGRFPKLTLDEHGAIMGDDVLQGHLIKFVRGRKTAEADLVFTFFYYSD